MRGTSPHQDVQEAPSGSDTRPTEPRSGAISGADRPIGPWETHLPGEIMASFDTTGGTSGSLIFDHLGWVIGVHHAGLDIGSISFGIRVDEVWDLIDHIDAQSSAVAEAPALAPSAATPLGDYPFDTYQPFPEHWNGETILP